jgi:hypothetical protein
MEQIVVLRLGKVRVSRANSKIFNGWEITPSNVKGAGSS